MSINIGLARNALPLGELDSLSLGELLAAMLPVRMDVDRPICLWKICEDTVPYLSVSAGTNGLPVDFLMREPWCGSPASLVRNLLDRDCNCNMVEAALANLNIRQSHGRDEKWSPSERQDYVIVPKVDVVAELNQVTEGPEWTSGNVLGIQS